MSMLLKKKPVETIQPKVLEPVKNEQKPQKKVKTEPTEKKEPSSWIKCTKEQRDELLEFRGFLKRLASMHRFDPEWADNIKHNRKEPGLLKKGIELMERIL